MLPREPHKCINEFVPTLNGSYLELTESILAVFTLVYKCARPAVQYREIAICWNCMLDKWRSHNYAHVESYSIANGKEVTRRITIITNLEYALATKSPFIKAVCYCCGLTGWSGTSSALGLIYCPPPFPSLPLGLQWGYSRGFDTKISPHHGAFDKQHRPTMGNLTKKLH